MIQWLKKKWQIRALQWMWALGAFFFLTYGSANYVSSKVEDVPSYFFNWETSIPFIPWMIIPYMSSDIIFVIGFLISRNKEEVFTLAKRVAFVISFSVLCYFIYPMKYAFDKPDVTGSLFKPVFDVLTADLPYNQCPSLHISQGFIFWVQFITIFKSRWAKWISHIWFALIYLSTLTVFQHHFVDILGGQLVALAAFFLFPDRSKANFRNEEFAYFYYFVSWAWFSAAFFTPILWSVLLIYFSLNYLFVGIAYHTGQNRVLTKLNGAHTWTTRIAFFHYILCAWLWWFFNSFISRKFYAEVMPGLFFGERPRHVEKSPIKADGSWSVIDLAPEMPEHPELLKLDYHYIPLTDMSYPSLDWALKVAEKIDELLKQNKKVYVHCRLGQTRSALAICSYLIFIQKLDTEQAFLKVAEAKQINLAPEFKKLFHP